MSKICDDVLPGTCPAVRVTLDWKSWFQTQIFVPLVVQGCLTVVFFLVLEPIFTMAYRYRRTGLRELVKTYVGTASRPEASRPGLLIFIFLLQIGSSLASVGLWVLHTYRLCPGSIGITEFVILAVDLLTWMVNRVRGQCKYTSVWELNGIVDTVTLVPVLRCLLEGDLQPGACGSWLSLKFLRSYQTLFCFQRIQETGHLQYSAVAVQMIIQVLFQVYCMLTIMAGTIFTCEVLGDPPIFTDKFIETAYGDRISFLYMVYWVMVSLTTVGYGDFAPRTTLSRILAAFFVVFGVAAIFFLEFRVAEFVKRRWEGSGSYLPRRRNDQHIVVILGLSGPASKLSSMIAGFLQEILHSSHDPILGDEEPAALSFLCCPRRNQASWPNVVILSPTNWDDGGQSGAEDHERTTSFNDFLRTRDIPPAARHRVWFLVGKVSERADLERARVGSSALTLLLTDINSETPDEADGQNIFAAVILRNFYPKLRLRVLLLRPESKEIAVQAGMPITLCFSAWELKANMLAQNVRCHGLLPVITGMLCSAGREDEEYFLKTMEREDKATQLRSGWTHEEVVGPTVSHSKSDASNKSGRDFVGRLTSNAKDRQKKRIDGRESLEKMKNRLRGSDAYWCKDKGEFEAVDPWMFAYFGGLQRSVHGFELAAHYQGLTFGELVYAIYRDTGAIAIGIFENGTLLICPQNTNKRVLTSGQICFAVAEKPEQLDPCRLAGRSPQAWRSRIMVLSRQRTKSLVENGAHHEATRICGNLLRDALSARPSIHSTLTKSAPAQRSSIKHVSTWTSEDGFRDTGHHRRATTPGQSGLLQLPLSMGSPLHSPDPSLGSIMPGRFSHLTVAEMDASRCSTPPNQEDSPFMRHHSSMISDDAKVEDEHNPELLRSSALGAQEARSRIRKLRANLTEHDELVVLVVCNGEVWQQVRTFVTCLRARHLPQHQPIVVVTPTAPPNGLLKDCGPDVVLLNGRLSTRVLLNSGILEASAVVVLTGEGVVKGHFHEPVFKDYKVMLLAQELECWCGISEREVFTTYELQDSRSVQHLPRLVNKQSKRLHELLEDVSNGEDTTVQAINTGTTTDVICEEEDEEGSDADEDDGHKQDLTRGGFEESVLFHPRFAAGQVFTPEIWGAMLGRCFYNPAIIETVEALVMPDRRGQHAFPWQIRVPTAYVGHRYATLVKDLALGCWEHGPNPRREEEDEPSSSRSTVGPAVPLALLRTRDDAAASFACSRSLSFLEDALYTQAAGTGGRKYNILAPPGSTKLRAEDWVLVIGSKPFGSKVYSLGLLRGSVPTGWGNALSPGCRDPTFYQREGERELEREGTCEATLDRIVSDSNPLSGEKWKMVARPSDSTDSSRPKASKPPKEKIIVEIRNDRI